MGNAAQKIRIKPLSISVDVAFDDTGFASNQYSANYGDTLQFDNKAAVDLTVYVFTSDGSSQTYTLLGTVNQVFVGGGRIEEYTVETSSGTFMLSLDPNPGLRAANTNNDPGGGSTTTVIVGN